MAIRMIAKELYKLQQEVEELEGQVESTPIPERAALEERLRRLRAERNRMRKILDGKKVSPPYRQVRWKMNPVISQTRTAKEIYYKQSVPRKLVPHFPWLLPNAKILNMHQPKGGPAMGISTISLVIVLFLLVMVLAMQFQIRQINRKMDELLDRRKR